jgi:hypothetical protein
VIQRVAFLDQRFEFRGDAFRRNIKHVAELPGRRFFGALDGNF